MVFGIGKPKRPTMVAFDIIGTVFPLEPLRPSIIALGMPPAGLEGWFAAGCRDAFAMAAVGDYEPFTTVLEASLEVVLAEQGLKVSADKRKAVVQQLETLCPRDGALEAFAILAEAGIRIMALSNGARLATKGLLAQCGLNDIVDEIVSVDEVKLTKPRMEVYLHAAKKAGIEPGELALVAAHSWDINGAARAGLVTAYLDADRPLSSAMRTPDLKGSALPDLSRQLAAL